MRIQLAMSKWSNGTNTLSIVDGDVDPADGYKEEDIAYEFDSSYSNRPSDKREPKPVAFYPQELRDLITEVRRTLVADPFSPRPNFDILRDWTEDTGTGVVGEVGSENLRKQFKMKCSDSGNLYLKVQRIKNKNGLYASPTLNEEEFEGLFSEISVI